MKAFLHLSGNACFVLYGHLKNSGIVFNNVAVDSESEGLGIRVSAGLRLGLCMA